MSPFTEASEWHWPPLSLSLLPHLTFVYNLPTPIAFLFFPSSYSFFLLLFFPILSHPKSRFTGSANTSFFLSNRNAASYTDTSHVSVSCHCERRSCKRTRVNTSPHPSPRTPTRVNEPQTYRKRTLFSRKPEHPDLDHVYERSQTRSLPVAQIMPLFTSRVKLICCFPAVSCLGFSLPTREIVQGSPAALQTSERKGVRAESQFKH